jgi:hypothetical protein
LSRTIDGAHCLLVNFTSGGTPVDGLVRGLLEARRDGFDWGGHLVVHAAGNSAVRARELLAEAGIESPPTLGAAVRRAVELGRPVAA